jgi:hypothetical protein
MWTALLPTLAMLVVIGWYIAAHRGQPVLQIHALIIGSYLNVFPMLDYLFSAGQGMESFAGYQALIICFFQIPLLLITHNVASRRRRAVAAAVPAPARLSPWLPWIFWAVLLVFWFVAIRYDLFFRRLGHDALQRNSAEVPALLLYLHRGAVETAFFVIVFLWTTLRCVARESRHYAAYRWSLIAYMASFIVFFGANSRMQFVLLLLCLICTQPHIAEFLVRKVKLLRLGILLAFLVVGLTLFRELYLEQNDRISTEDLPDLLLSVGWLIAARLDSVVIMYRLHDAGFNPWGVELSGVIHVLRFYSSFFFDPPTYLAIKESLVTSPSVEIINRMLSLSEVDFPKSMILDMFLSFGTVGLLATAAILGTLVGFVQRQLAPFRGFRFAFIAAIYLLPILLEFEKEFLGFIFASLKWTPMLLLLYWHRPRYGRRRDVPRRDPAPALAPPAVVPAAPA